MSLFQSIAAAPLTKGKALAAGTIAALGPASNTVVTGLAKVDFALVSLKDAPTATHLWSVADIGDQAGTPDAGSILVNHYKVTDPDTDITPTPGVGNFGAVDWIAIGDLT